MSSEGKPGTTRITTPEGKAEWYRQERDKLASEVEAAKNRALYLEQYVKRATDAEEALHRITELQPYEGPKAKAIADAALADEGEA